jgi:threonyl-tRNA synthetase
MELSLKRHSLAHIMAQAVKQNFPEVKIATGPSTEDGFYYDFDFGTVEFSEKDLKTVEKTMKKIITQNQDFRKFDVDFDSARKIVEAMWEWFKSEIIDKLESWDFKNKEKISDKITFYMNISKGKNSEYYEKLQDFLSKEGLFIEELDWDQVKNLKFMDMCTGPHVWNTKDLDANSFNLAKVAGAYWMGDDKNKMLTRIYAYAFNNKEELDAHLNMLVEARKRDHRIIWKKMDIFSFSENVWLGLPLWHPMGWRIWRSIEDFWLEEHIKWWYEFVRTPHIWNQKLWETSGHWGFYSDSMYPALEVWQTLEDSKAWKKIEWEHSEKYLLKPMNCPFHVEIYNHSPKSYRELPLKWAELGTVYRYEKKWQLGWLTRVRWFTQDDAHIFCTKEQVKEEFSKVVDFIDYIVKSFGLEYQAYLSFRDPKSDKYVWSDEMWKLSQNVLKEVAEEKWLNAPIEEWEAAFYWPKIDFRLKDCIGREHQCSTVQFDFNLPERFNMSFTNKEWEQEQPFAIHRALFWSFERFISILIEHYAWVFPLWFSPRQVIIIPVAEKFDDYAKTINTNLLKNWIRTEIDFSSDSFSKKIRNAEKNHINYILVVWEQEEKDNSVSVRNYKTKEQSVESLEEFKGRVVKEIKERSL